MNRQRRINAAAPAPLSTFDVSKADAVTGRSEKASFAAPVFLPDLCGMLLPALTLPCCVGIFANLLTAAALDRIISDLVRFWVSGGRLALVMPPGNSGSTAAFAVPASAYFPENKSEP